MEEAQRLCIGRGPGRDNLGLVIMMTREHLDMGVEGQGQMLMPRLIRVMVMPRMQMGQWVAGKRQNQGR
jgi:hypothetical protein